MDHKPLDFSKFKLKPIIRVPINERAYRSRYGGYRTNEPVRSLFTIEDIKEIIESGDIKSQRELSCFMYRTNSFYRNNIDRLASLPLYDTVVIPLLNGNGSKKQIIKNFIEACEFIDNLDLPNVLNHITKEWLKVGIYYGILREDGKKVVIQDLPFTYCRTRFKSFDNLNILEFNLQYFENIFDKGFREEAIKTFPEAIQKAWKNWTNNKKGIDPWVAILPEDGGICFGFLDDPTPLLLGSIIQLKKLDDAIKREETRDENELYKILIQKMPRDKDGELIFQLEEIAQIHASVADMLAEEDTIEVLTTLGDATLESLQDTSAATQSSDRINKYKGNAFDALGTSNILYNADGSSTLAYSLKKDESLMISYLNVYESWLKFQLNHRFKRNGLEYDFEILPTTVFNRDDMINAKFRGAQYGYSKMFAGVVMGIKQRDQISLMDFENEYLKMSEKMIPLQSSYTTSGNNVANEEKSNSGAQTGSGKNQPADLTNKGGRPELPDEEKSEKTQANIKAAG